MGEAFDKAGPYRIAQSMHDDRNRAGCALQSMSARGRGYGDDVGVEAHTFSGQCRILVGAALSREIIDRERLPVHIPKLTQSLEEPLESCRRRLRRTWIERKKAEPWHLRGLLPSRGERP